MSNEKLLNAARAVGIEDEVQKLITEKYGRDFIVDFIFQKAGRGKSHVVVDISSVDDETLIRALCDPKIDLG